MNIGFSTTTIASSLNLDRLLEFGPECVEVCNYPSENWPQVLDFLRRCELPSGLHCPLPYRGWVSHFEITGPNQDRRREAMLLVRHTLEAAHEAGAAYVVIHFPTVFTGFNGEADRRIAASDYRDMVFESAWKLSRMSRSVGVPLLLENVGPNPYFYTSAHFREVFEQIPDLGMCLDFGHAHVLPIGEDVYSFTKNVRPHVHSVHLYNATSRNYQVGYHEMAMPGQAEAEGWMDLPRLLRIISEGSPLRYVIFEHSCAEGERIEEAMASLRWIREILGNLC